MTKSKIDYIIVGLEIIDSIKNLSNRELTKILNHISSTNKLDVIYDENDKRYCVVGKILKRDNGDQYLNGMFNINHNKLNQISQEVKTELLSSLKEIDFLPENIFSNQIDLYSLTHYL